MYRQKKQLLQALKLASGGLASKEDVPSLASFFFDGQHVRTYDDQISIETVCNLPVEGGIMGRPLMAWLNSCSGEDVTMLTLEDTYVELSCGRSRMKFPLLEPGQFAFAPSEDDGMLVPAPYGLVEAIEKCASFIGNDPAYPWRMGLTINIDSDRVANVYATDNFTMGNAWALVVADDVCEVTLPPRFVKLLKDMTNTCPVAAFEFDDDWVSFVLEDEAETRVFTRTLGSPDSEGFERIFQGLFSSVDRIILIPDEMPELLKRAEMVIRATQQESAILRIASSTIEVTTSGTMGSLMDTVPFEGEHDPCKQNVLPGMLLAALQHADYFGVSDRAVVLQGDEFRAMVSVVGD